MPLTGTGDVLGMAMKAQVDAVPDKSVRDDVWKAMGRAVIAHVIANGANAITVTVASVAGVTPGPSASGPGTGVGTIT